MDNTISQILPRTTLPRFDITASHKYDLIPLNGYDVPQTEMANMPFDLDYNRYLHSALSTFVDHYGLRLEGWKDILIVPQNRNDRWLYLSAADVNANPVRLKAMEANLYANEWDPDSIPEEDCDFQRKRKAEIVWPMLVVTIPGNDPCSRAISGELRAAMQTIMEKIQALIAVGTIMSRVPFDEFQAVLDSVQQFEHLGGVTIGFQKTLNAALELGLYRMQNGSPFDCCKETPPLMTLAERVEAVRAVGFWIERFDDRKESEGVEYFYFSNEMRRKYGEIMLYLQDEPFVDDNNGKCNYASELFKDDNGWARVMW